MNYQQFVSTLREKLFSILGETTDVQLHTALKNNGNERVGLTFSDKSVNLSPTIYLEEFYKHYQDGETIEAIVECILEVYHEVKFEHSWDVHSISDFDAIKEKIVYKVIHEQQNETLLKELPFVPYLDFAIVFYILFEVDEKGTATIPVTNDLVRLWETSLTEIHQIAKQNTPQLLPAVFKPMRIVIEELLGNPCDNIVRADDIMFVLTNSLRNLGAACILYDDILFHICNFLKDSFYILPSSIHEVIIIPETHAPDKDTLNDMVLEVNETQVGPEDILSNHVYYYDCRQHTLLQ